MKLKSLLVITLFVVACGFASAQSFGFGTAGGLYLYCNYEQLSVYGGTVYQGVDNLSACGASYNGTVAGIKGGLTAAGNPIGFAVTGVTYGDNIYDADSLAYTGAQWDVTAAAKCVKKNKKTGKYGPKYGWIGFASVSGVIFGNNYGFLTCDLPTSGASPVKGMSIGNGKIPRKN